MCRMITKPSCLVCCVLRQRKFPGQKEDKSVTPLVQRISIRLRISSETASLCCPCFFQIESSLRIPESIAKRFQCIFSCIILVLKPRLGGDGIFDVAAIPSMAIYVSDNLRRCCFELMRIPRGWSRSTGIEPVMTFHRMTFPNFVVQVGEANGECAPSAYQQLSRHKRIAASSPTPSANAEYSIISDSE